MPVSQLDNLVLRGSTSKLSQTFYRVRLQSIRSTSTVFPISSSFWGARHSRGNLRDLPRCITGQTIGCICHSEEHASDLVAELVYLFEWITKKMTLDTSTFRTLKHLLFWGLNHWWAPHLVQYWTTSIQMTCMRGGLVGGLGWVVSGDARPWMNTRNYLIYLYTPDALPKKDRACWGEGNGVLSLVKDHRYFNEEYRKIMIFELCGGWIAI